MLHSDKSYRFTAPEVASCREAGLDLQSVTTPDALANALEPWLYAIAEVRPDLFDRIAQELAAAKAVCLPPRLSVVSIAPSPDCPD
jgi:hypothetical protein